MQEQPECETRWYFIGCQRKHPQVNSALHPSGVAKSSTSFGWGKGGNFTSVGLQVTLCDPIWHVSSRSGVATLRTAIHLLLTYLLTPNISLGSLLLSHRILLSSVGQIQLQKSHRHPTAQGNVSDFRLHATHTALMAASAQQCCTSIYYYYYYYYHLTASFPGQPG